MADKNPTKDKQNDKKGGRSITEKENTQRSPNAEHTPKGGNPADVDDDRGNRTGTKGPGSARDSDGNQIDKEEQHIRGKRTNR
jgi:hypothetical protein